MKNNNPKFTLPLVKRRKKAPKMQSPLTCNVTPSIEKFNEVFEDEFRYFERYIDLYNTNYRALFTKYFKYEDKVKISAKKGKIVIETIKEK